MKNINFFAQDATAISTVIAMMGEHIQAQPDLHWAALVDAAFDYPATEPAPYTFKGINCYQLDAFEGLQGAAPWLVPLPSDDPNQQELRKLLRHCRERPMLSFVASRQPAITLKDDWANLHWVCAEDEQNMLLRLADTRILPVLPQVLTPEQWSAFTAPLEHWLLINREGQLVTCPLANKCVIASKKIKLTQAQLDALLHVSEADAVIDLLVENMPEIIPVNIKKSQLYKIVNESCVLAQAHRIEVFSDTVSLAVAACLTSGESNTNKKLIVLLDAGKWISAKLGDAILAENII
jgi:hypothetical protein